MFLAFKEKRFAKRIVKRLLKSHATVSAGKPDLSGKALYREVLLHTRQVDPSRVDEVLREAEVRFDEWTIRDSEELGFRDVVHSFIMSQYVAAGHAGAVVSFRDIVCSMIPADF
jgi:hypothetical protein